MKRVILRAIIEVAFIIFLFYANLLMGEFTHNGMGHEKGLSWAVANILTTSNFAIAVIAALVGYFIFEFLRKSL